MFASAPVVALSTSARPGPMRSITPPRAAPITAAGRVTTEISSANDCGLAPKDRVKTSASGMILLMDAAASTPKK